MRAYTNDRSPYVGTRLSAVLADQGRRVGWFASKMGYSAEHVSRVIHGRLPITREFVRRASQALDMPADALFFLEPPIHSRMNDDGRAA